MSTINRKSSSAKFATVSAALALGFAALLGACGSDSSTDTTTPLDTAVGSGETTLAPADTTVTTVGATDTTLPSVTSTPTETVAPTETAAPTETVAPGSVVTTVAG